MRLWLVVFAWLPLLHAAHIPNRYIVELEGEPVVQRKDRRDRIRAEHSRMRARVQDEQATVLDSVENVANALLVEVPDSRVERLRRLPGVRGVRPVREFKLLLDRTILLHRVPEALAILPVERAGSGMKIGIIDTGIDTDHPGFLDPSLLLPQGFPRVNTNSDRDFTSTKVILARSYSRFFRRRDPDPSARDHVGHGTALGMAAAGVLTPGPLATISGVAPKAYLGNYKVFGSPGVNDGAPEDAILKAIDDAAADGMDVISLSLGSDLAPAPQDDPVVRALERVAAMGILVVVAAGNNGPDPNTIGSPATAPTVISVGASTSDRIFAAAATVDDGTLYVAIPGSGSSGVEPISGPLVEAGQACGSLPEPSLAGRIALISRGDCTFEQKLTIAQGAGAIAALVYSTPESPDPIEMFTGSATLPAEMISYASGMEIRRRLADRPDLRITLRFTLGPAPSSPDQVAAFSSRGPSVDGTLKPELLAVGTSVYTATQRLDSRGAMYDASGFTVTAGTSFSAPVVAGAAAFLKSARPGLTSDQYRSLVVHSATPLGVLDVSAGLRATAAATPVVMNFGPDATRSLTLSNVGTADETYAISAVTRDGAPGPALSSNAVQLAPGASAEITVSFGGMTMRPGGYAGFLRIQGTNTGVETRVPYWYTVPSGVARHITLLASTGSARRGSVVNQAVVFRAVEESGIVAAGAVPSVTVVSGEGEVADLSPRNDLSPGAHVLSVRLGPRAGLNVFRIEAGEAAREITITGR